MNYETINEEAFEMNKVTEVNISNSEIKAYLEEVISLNIEEDYEFEAYENIKWNGKIKSSHLNKIKRNMYELHIGKF